MKGPKWKGSKLANDFIPTRLDRGLVSATFSQLFPSCIVQNTYVSHFDHLALVISLSHGVNVHTNKRPRNKHFEHHWLKDEECFVYFNKLWLRISFCK